MAPASAAAPALSAAWTWRSPRPSPCSASPRFGWASPISTHLAHAIGPRQTRRYTLTGERFDAREAERIGLAHDAVAADQAEAKLAAVLDAIFLSGPDTIAITRRSFPGANGLLLGERQMTLLTHEGWTRRAPAEGHEGTLAFREKRRPSWYRAPLA